MNKAQRKRQRRSVEALARSFGIPVSTLWKLIRRVNRESEQNKRKKRRK